MLSSCSAQAWGEVHISQLHSGGINYQSVWCMIMKLTKTVWVTLHRNHIHSLGFQWLAANVKVGRRVASDHMLRMTYSNEILQNTSLNNTILSLILNVTEYTLISNIHSILLWLGSCCTQYLHNWYTINYHHRILGMIEYTNWIPSQDGGKLLQTPVALVKFRWTQVLFIGPVRLYPSSHSYVATVPNGMKSLGNWTLPLSGCANSRHWIAVWHCVLYKVSDLSWNRSPWTKGGS